MDFVVWIIAGAVVFVLALVTFLVLRAQRSPAARALPPELIAELTKLKFRQLKSSAWTRGELLEPGELYFDVPAKEEDSAYFSVRTRVREQQLPEINQLGGIVVWLWGDATTPRWPPADSTFTPIPPSARVNITSPRVKLSEAGRRAFIELLTPEAEIVAALPEASLRIEFEAFSDHVRCEVELFFQIAGGNVELLERACACVTRVGARLAEAVKQSPSAFRS